MTVLSAPSLELRCMGPDPHRPGRPCRRTFARVDVPHVRVQQDGTAMICPRCGSVTRFAAVMEAA